MFEEDGIDYTVTSRGYAFAKAMVGSTMNYMSYGISRKKPTRKKKTARQDESCIVNFAHGESVECAKLVDGNRITEFYDEQFIKTEPLNFPKSFLSKLGMKDYSDKPDLNKALTMLFEHKITWVTFDKICKVANVEYKVVLK